MEITKEQIGEHLRGYRGTIKTNTLMKGFNGTFIITVCKKNYLWLKKVLNVNTMKVELIGTCKNW